MSRIMGLVLAGGLVLGTAASAQAQVGVYIGGAPVGGYYPNSYGYNSGYSGFVAPTVPYSPVYVAPRVTYPAPIYGYPAYRTYRPAYGYGYGYPYRPGFRPFRRNWW